MASSAEFGLSGRTAVVTGASRGIGRAIVRRLAAANARVALVARPGRALEEAAAEAAGLALACDVADAGAVAGLANRLRDAWGGAAPDLVVNAAGTFGLAPIAGTDPAEFDRHLAVNLRGPFLMIRTFLPGMLERKSGHILSVGSVAGRQAFPENGAYAASKSGLRGLHAVLALELKGTGVRSTLIEPAATDTPLWDAIDRSAHRDLPAPAAMLSADAVADAALFAVTRPPGTGIPTISLERA
jgi:NAD(P)-dependent dehydrogenase (short-subunit alcohol dehydrogenase family)